MNNIKILVVCFLVGNSLVSEFYMPKFRITLFHLHSQVGVEWLSFYTYPPMKMEQTECSETSGYQIQSPGNYPEENIQHTEHGKSLKSRIKIFMSICKFNLAFRLAFSVSGDGCWEDHELFLCVWFDDTELLALYSVAGRWVSKILALVEWYWQGNPKYHHHELLIWKKYEELNHNW